MDSVGECEGLSVQREAHHQPLPVRPEAHPVLEAVVGVEVLAGVSLRHVERRQVARLAVPVAVVVVRHHVDDVEISVQFRDVVTCGTMGS